MKEYKVFTFQYSNYNFQALESSLNDLSKDSWSILSIQDIKQGFTLVFILERFKTT
ncbi:MAG: hypothetical protein JWP12_2591 [Bacteroidetes bacterium]|nr:hypothetical protein [Bacteroidota bacterium]